MRLLKLIVPGALLISGCAMQPSYQRPALELPDRWQGAQTTASVEAAGTMAEWWRAFEDRTLDRLEDAVLADNRDVRAATHRIAQARAALRATGASRYPALTGSVGAARSRPFSGNGAANKFSAELNIGWEPDLWDRFANLTRAAHATVDAASEAGRAVKLTLAADTATTYFQLAAATQRLELARNTLTVAERIDSIVEARHRNGAVSGLDRAQSQSNLAAIRSSLPPLEQTAAQARYLLDFLAGQAPAKQTIEPPLLTDVRLPARTPAGLPSELLRRRPDILQAEANLRAAYADVGVARANLYPSLQLTTDAGYASAQLSNLLKGSSGLLSVGAGLLAPIFQADKLQALSERAQERHAELVQTYHHTILGALREVESALVGLEKLAAQEAAQQDTIGHTKRAFDLAETRYRAGLIDALNLLNTQNAMLKAEDEFLLTRFERISTLVGLYRALGGGWQQ